jgi:hypothetical protein
MRKRTIGIKQVSPHPGERAEADDDEKRRPPDDQLEMGGVVPFRLVGRLAVARPIAEGEEGRQRHHRDDDQEHQDGRLHEQVALLFGDIAGRVEHDEIAAAQRRQRHDDECSPEQSQLHCPHVRGSPST